MTALEPVVLHRLLHPATFLHFYHLTPLIQLVYLGDSMTTMPAAASIAAWLTLNRVWRTALSWCLLFCAGLLLVAASKIAYIGWGLEIEALAFQGLSGHAMRTTAVMPVLLFALMRPTRDATRYVAVLLGLAAGIAMVGLLVAFDYHTVSESVGGFLLGAAVSLGFLKQSKARLASITSPWALPCSLFIFLLVWVTMPPPLHQWMTKVAAILATETFPWQVR